VIEHQESEHPAQSESLKALNCISLLVVRKSLFQVFD